MSSEEAAFLAAIAANPDDRLPRYVYSDWLEDGGDERCFWVRDDALWPHMGPRAENPIPRVLEAVEAELRRAADFASAEELWITDPLETNVDQLVELLGRCGPRVVAAVFERLTREDPWPRIVQDVCLPFPFELAPVADRLTTDTDNARAEVAQAAACLLVRVAELQPDRLDSVLMDVWRSGDPRTERALTALTHARGPIADRIADSWIGHLTDDLKQPELDDLPLFVGKLGCLADMTDVPPAAQPLFETALRDTRPEVVEAGSMGLRRLGEQVASEAAEKAIRECTEHNRAGAFGVVRAAWPDWVPRLLALLKEPDLPEQTRLGAVECLEHADKADWLRVLPVLRKGITDKAEAMRRVAQLALARMKVPTEWVLVHLREARKEKSAKVRAEVVTALIERHVEDERLPPSLFAEVVATFADPRMEVRDQVATVLNNLELGHLLAREAQRLSRSPTADDRVSAARLFGYFDGYSVDNFPRLLELFDDRELAVRRAAVQAVAACISPSASGVYKPLKRALRDPDAIIRGAAATAFGRLGQRSAELLPELLELTRDSIPIARAGATFAVAMIDIDDEDVVKAVLRGLADENERVIQSTLEGIEETTSLEGRKMLARILANVTHPTAKIRQLAFQVLGHFDEEELPPEAIRAGIDGLRDEDIEVAEAAFGFLPNTDEVNRRALPHFFELYASPRCTVRESLGGQIRYIPDALAHFARMFDHADPDVRWDSMAWMQDVAVREPERRAEVVRLVLPRLKGRLTAERGKNLAQALDLAGEVGPPAAEVLPLVEPLCRHDNADVRAAALRAVGRFGPASRGWIEPLRAILYGDGNVNDRAAAAAGLVSLSGQDPSLLPDLLDRLRTDAVPVRRWIADRAGRHPELGEQLIPAVLERIEDSQEEDEVRDVAIESLGELGRAMRPHADRLARCLLLDLDNDALEGIIRSLATLGEVAVAALPHLRRFLETSDDDACLFVCDALAVIPGDERPLAILAGLRHSNPDVREHTALLLKDLPEDAEEIIPDICRTLDSTEADLTLHTSIRDDDDKVSSGDDDRNRDLFELSCDIREDLLETLGKLGKKAVGAIPTIVRYLDDEVEDVRIAAVEALVAIGPRARDALRKAARSEYEDVAEIAEEALDELDDRR